jgi:hypothetical protein
LPIEIPSMILKGIKTRYFSPLPISSSSFNSNYINPLLSLKNHDSPPHKSIYHNPSLPT